ncbi:hypothetical protein [Pseudonocardia sp. TMWB2A]|uniref:hypothetical protein n=1 Tax=Pseudonocardia sp. TMWB2A TaxID=687430 RepID=UPI00307DEF45
MGNKDSRSRHGICKLTGASGKLVKSHIIPRALTPPKIGGAAFSQIGNGQQPVRRFDSWYDPNLVTQHGEDILTDYDTYAISELRRLQLIWHSWGPMQVLSTSDFDPLARLRVIRFRDPAKMRLFFLSLLWRAAATQLSEFREIELNRKDMKLLRRIVRDGWMPDDSFYPISLVQLSNLGVKHNLTPLAQTKFIPPVSDAPARSQPIFRFYFDGLIAHVHRDCDDTTLEGIEPFMVGNQQTLVMTIPTEQSWQRQNLDNLVFEADRDFPSKRIGA